MGRKTGIWRKAYWDAAKTTIASVGAADVPTYAECVAAFGKSNFLAGVEGFPDFGSEANLVPCEEFGEPEVIEIAGQGQPTSAVLGLVFMSENAKHKAMADLDSLGTSGLANGSPFLLATWAIDKYGTGTDAGHPDGTDSEGTFRILEGTKASGLIEGGTVNDKEIYTLTIAVVKRITIYNV